MMNKKIIGTMVVGLVLVGFASKVSAQQTINGNNGLNSAEVEVKGNLGDQDNTDPGTPLPDGDDKWINVTLPTSTVFFAKSSPTKDFELIYTPDSMEQKIENHSARPVKVMLEKYDLVENDSTPAIQKLNLRNADSNQEIEIAKEGHAIDFSEEGSQLFTILDAATKNGTKDKVNFDYTGISNPSKIKKGSNGEVEGTLGFKFISLPLNQD